MSRKIDTIAAAGTGTSIAYAVHRMLPFIAIAVGLVGCVMPPDAEYVLTPANQPPRITSASPTPYVAIVYQSPACEPIEQLYSVSVRDPDLTDTIYWRAFVDYSTNSTFASGQLDNADQDLPIPFPVRGDDSRFRKAMGVPHIVEIIVADRPFADDDRAPRAHALLNGGFTASTIWAVQYSDTSCGP